MSQSQKTSVLRRGIKSELEVCSRDNYLLGDCFQFYLHFATPLDKAVRWVNAFRSCYLYFYVPKDAEDHNSCGKRDEGNAVANSVADLHLPEKPSLLKTHINTQTAKHVSSSDAQKSTVTAINIWLCWQILNIFCILRKGLLYSTLSIR